MNWYENDISKNDVVTLPDVLAHKMMTSLVNKSDDRTPNYHKILIFSPPTSLKSLCVARIDELTDSNEPPNTLCTLTLYCRKICLFLYSGVIIFEKQNRDI